jgi:hypothetical protein
MNLAKKLMLLLLVAFGLLPALTQAQPEQQDSYRDVVIYPYHAAPYYSYPFTTGYGYHYSVPIVNAEYVHAHNDRGTVLYPDGPYQYENYYRIGNSMCYQVAHKLYCSY